MAATITVSEARDGLLMPVLDALASNALQGRLLIDPSPEVDSLVEKIAALRRHGVPGETLRDLLRDCQHVIELNHGEAASERTASENADRITRRAEHARTAPDARGTRPTVRSVSARLRPALRTILAHREGPPTAPQPMSLARAWFIAHDVIVRTPTRTLLGSGMQTTLGRCQYGLLLELASEHDQHAREASR